jgi:hypothetical protein
MPNVQKCLSSPHDNGTGINLRLIPKLEPARAHRFGQVQQRTRGCFGQQYGQAVAQALLVERQQQRWKQGNGKLFGEILDGLEGGRIALGKGEDLSVKIPGRERSQHPGGADTTGGQPENDKVGRSCVERRAELAGLDALIDGEMKLAQRLSQKLSNVVLTIGNADMWHGRSVL